MIKIFISLSLLVVTVYAKGKILDNTVSNKAVYLDLNIQEVDLKNEQKAKEEYQKKVQEEKEREKQIQKYLDQLALLQKKIGQEQVWMKSYSSYLTSLDVHNRLDKINKRIEYLQHSKKNSEVLDELNSLIAKRRILTTQVNNLSKKDSALFSKLLTPPKIHKVVQVTNPFDIINGVSMIKTLDTNLQDYTHRKQSLESLLQMIKQENELYQKIVALDTKHRYDKEAKKKQKQLEQFKTALDTLNVSLDLYQKRIEAIEANIQKGIEEQVVKLTHIGIVLFIVILIFFLLKLVVKKYISDNDRLYMANKALTFMNVTIIILVISFNYIENVSHFVTILGFASAGIAIAMKDWFMSILGWLVIIFGGSIHVGDRIRVDMDGMKYVGDVMDISLLRMTILEDITLTTYKHNRRAGRVFFVPNNYIFTRMIANYSHSSLKTVWDGIDVTITFDSNHKKAMHICKEITKKYSKGYTDITRKQLNKIRRHYSLKNTNVEPRILSFIESNGIVISSWYLTNAYATLTLRSTISTEIIDAFKKEDDIQISYPTQKLYLDKESSTFAEQNEVV
ncbi:MscS family mechanosensitive ion channel [hydrothermal vent metagenome]|uniref:MscS family mechanosensitive ion channel n=1 Tax=hydrothermal vent metagenome TaxID=652676 RepID=A0A1W1D2P6_9ZZZZ